MRRWPLPASSRATQAKVDFSVFFSGCNAFPRATRTRAFPPMYRWPLPAFSRTRRRQRQASPSFGGYTALPRVTQTRAFPPMYRWPPPASFRTRRRKGRLLRLLRMSHLPSRDANEGFSADGALAASGILPRVMRTKATAACLCAQKAHRLSVSARAKGGAKRPAASSSISARAEARQNHCGPALSARGQVTKR